MRKNLISVAFISVFFCFSAHSANFPKQLLGTWGEPSACEANKETGMGVDLPGATIESDNVSWIEVGCDLLSIKKENEQKFRAKIKCHNENGSSDSMIIISKKGNKISINDGEYVPLCAN